MLAAFYGCVIAMHCVRLPKNLVSVCDDISTDATTRSRAAHVWFCALGDSATAMQCIAAPCPVARSPPKPSRLPSRATARAQDALLPRQTASSARVVLASKTGGAAVLASSMAALPLRSVALFSSAAALLGSAGQAAYAAANATLDCWASAQQAQVPRAAHDA